MNIDRLTPLELTLEEMGRRLARTRKQQGLSQDDLALAAGIGVATLRRMEGGSDSQMGSWIKALQGLDMIHAVDSLLPEAARSPMADAKAARKNQGPRKRASMAGRPEADGPWSEDAP